MKRGLRNYIALALVAAYLSACTANALKVEYQTVGTTVKTVDLAMKTWASFVNAGSASDVQQQSVRDAYGKYQTALTLAQTSLHVSEATETPTELQAAAAAIVALISEFTGKRVEVTHG